MSIAWSGAGLSRSPWGTLAPDCQGVPAMAEGNNATNASQRGEGRADGNQRGGRGSREPGGFRIRLSDNEMRAARAVQEAFGLRSTVAALGLSLRAVAQLLEEGRIDDLLAEQRQAAAARPAREPRGEGRGESRGEGHRTAHRANPFARPQRPAAPAAAETPSADQASAETTSPEITTLEATSAEDLSPEAALSPPDDPQA